jgi:hypothetical protein
MDASLRLCERSCAFMVALLDLTLGVSLWLPRSLTVLLNENIGLIRVTT